MKVLDLFAGIGGFSLAAHWMGWETVGFVEQNEYCQKVLRKNFDKKIPIYGDIREFTGTRGQADIITGGFPCQPFSLTGNMEGEADERYLWPEMFRIIREVMPFAVIAENVSGITTVEDGQTLERVCLDLESAGYKVQPIIVPACAVGAWHRRNRVWFIAYNSQIRVQGFGPKKIQEFQRISWGKDVGGFEDIRSRPDIPKPLICRNDDGFPERVDRLGALGNAIVPHVAFEIFRAIDIAYISTDVD